MLPALKGVRTVRPSCVAAQDNDLVAEVTIKPGATGQAVGANIKALQVVAHPDIRGQLDFIRHHVDRIAGGPEQPERQPLSAVAHGLAVTASDVLLPVAYGAGYAVILLVIATLIFERRDFR